MLELARFETACLLRPLLTRLPRAYGLAYRMILGPVGSSYHGDPLFKKKLARRHRVFFDRHLGCYMVADVGDATSRNHYILGRYCENFIQQLIRKVLKPGDTFIDVGANRGVHSLYAARYLAPGWVFSFEPNPRTFRILQAHMTINNCNNGQQYNIGVSDSKGVLTLHLFSDDAPSGCSFIEKGESPVQETFEVSVSRLDEVLSPADLRGRVLLKVDTEGFDHRAIRGMGALLDYDQLAISTEIQDEWLRKAGSSAQGLFDDLVGRGFQGFLPSIRFHGIKETLGLDPIERVPDITGQYDLFFAKPGMVSGPNG
jgi:FkbM family methyltransferase